MLIVRVPDAVIGASHELGQQSIGPKLRLRILPRQLVCCFCRENRFAEIIAKCPQVSSQPRWLDALGHRSQFRGNEFTDDCLIRQMR